MSEPEENAVQDAPRLRLEESLNSHCPWSGDPVSEEGLVRYRGRVLGFCNRGCRKKFEAAISVFDPLVDRAVG